MADTSSATDWSSLIGPGLQAGASLYGNSQATNALTSAEQAAIGTQQGVQGQLSGIYGAQRGLGTGADNALGAQLGLGGTPDYAAFQNSPGFQGSLALGNQAITRAASANGSLYTPNMLNQLGQYDTTYASQNYNSYIGQLMQAAGLGASGNSGLATGITSTGGNISQLQQNQGNANAGGAANASGIAGTLLGKLPYGQIGTGVSNLFSGSSSTGTPNADTTNGVYNGGAFGGGAPLYDSSTGGYPGASDGSDLSSGSYDWLNQNPQ